MLLLFKLFLIIYPFRAFALTEVCQSVKGSKIEHHDYVARESGQQKRILVIGQIHGDELESGKLAHLWMDRLNKIKSPSNHWRIIPLVNPDGFALKTRMNANGVDLNRNFPTKDWDELALSSWQKRNDPRRYPGPSAGSEIEVKCLITHIELFRPDIIVAIHTPYGLFDFDGPSDIPAASRLLPWTRLGTFVGSLGRWAWDERQIPVLTIELTERAFRNSKQGFILFQDKISDLIPQSKKE